jgi:flagellar hook-length control protein FliK
MSRIISPEAAQPATTQSFEQSDRNPVVANPVGMGDGGPMLAPAASASRITQPGPAPSADAGLLDYDYSKIANGVQDEAERES